MIHLQAFADQDGVSFNTTITLTPAKVAELFWSMYSDEQRAFFNHLGKIAVNYKLESQLYMVMAEKTADISTPLNSDGINALRAIVETFTACHSQEDHG